MSNKTSAYEGDVSEIIANKDVLKRTTEKFLSNMIDEITFGVILECHRMYRTNAWGCINVDETQDQKDAPPLGVHIFGEHTLKKTQECQCPICDRTVSAPRFAPHLANCMGMGRSRSRNPRRSTSNSSRERDSSSSSSCSSIASDDEDDVDWGSCDNKRYKKKKDRNGFRKGKGTPKKTNEPESVEPVDVEGDEEVELGSLKDCGNDRASGSSPVEALCNFNLKKRDKSRKKNGRRDGRGGSTNSTLNGE